MDKLRMIDQPIVAAKQANEECSFPCLSSELWLQILESISDVQFLWTIVRTLSRTYKSYVDRTITSTYLSDLSISLSLPRHDPKTGALHYLDIVPTAQLTLSYHGMDDSKSFLVPTTIPAGPNGRISIEELTTKGVLFKERLEEAEVWMWFGRNQGKGVGVTFQKDFHWDEHKKIWLLTVEWEKLHCGVRNHYFRGRHP